MIYDLRPYQQRALNEIRRAISEGHKSIKETSAEVSSYLDKKRQDFARKKSYAQAKNKGATP